MVVFVSNCNWQLTIKQNIKNESKMTKDRCYTLTLKWFKIDAGFRQYCPKRPSINLNKWHFVIIPIFKLNKKKWQCFNGSCTRLKQWHKILPLGVIRFFIYKLQGLTFITLDITAKFFVLRELWICLGSQQYNFIYPPFID